jgi:hypothetical protein
VVFYFGDNSITIENSMAHKLLIVCTLAIAGIMALFASTNPERLPAAVFIGFFVLLYGICYSLLALLGMLLRRLDIVSWSLRRVMRTALAVACLPVFLLVLQSIGQLTFKDVLLVLGLFVLLYLYFGRVLVQESKN